MAQFSTSDINDAKRRVEQMHQRARHFVEDNGPDDVFENQPKSDTKQSCPTQTGFSISSILKKIGVGGEGKDENSSGLILALILILSREKADNMLILALLYILL